MYSYEERIRAVKLYEKHGALYSLRAFLNKKIYDDAMELINKVIAQAENRNSNGQEIKLYMPK